MAVIVATMRTPTGLWVNEHEDDTIGVRWLLWGHGRMIFGTSETMPEMERSVMLGLLLLEVMSG